MKKRTREQKEASRISSQKNRDKIKDGGKSELRGVFVETKNYERVKEKVINFLKMGKK